MRRAAAAVLAAVLLVPMPVQAEASSLPPMRDVMIVGNNWAGTASIVDAHTFKVLRSGIDLAPDRSAEILEIFLNPVRLAFYLLTQQGPGEGHDQLVDDMFATNDGRLLAVSRPSLGDVVWVDIAKALAGDANPIVVEQQMVGYRTDHMGVSPDGTRLVVSDSTARVVHEYVMGGYGDPSTGKRLRSFESGETPHESNYSKRGTRIFHASIGRVYTPGDTLTGGPVKIGPLHDALKGDRWFQIVRNHDFKVTKRWDMGKELEEAGYPGMQSAVRPMAVAPDQRYVYLQVSYFHGLVEFDTRAADLDGKLTYTSGGRPEPRRGAVRRVIPLPNHVPDMLLDQYVNDSAHHGLAINHKGRKLCAAGTMDDYVAIVNRRSGKAKLLNEETTGHHYGKPYWTTEGLHNTCWASLSEADAVAVIDFRTGRQLAYLAVGDHPQRVRAARIPTSLLG